MLVSLFKNQKLIFTPQEGIPGYHKCYKEASPLLPSTYSHGPHPTPSAGATTKVELYKEDSQMGNDVMSIWYQKCPVQL